MRATFLFAFVCLVTLSGLAQRPVGQVTPLEPEKPMVYDNQSAALRGKKTQGLYTEEEERLCLFRKNELVAAFDSLTALQGFYEEYGANKLWDVTRSRLFLDRAVAFQALRSPEAEQAQQQPKQGKRVRPEDILGAALAQDFSFCLVYLGINPTDAQLVDLYLQPKRKIVSAITGKKLPVRLQAWILANDFYRIHMDLSPGLTLPESQ
jgi:hypothetical protein